MSDTHITGIIKVGEEEIKLAVHDNAYADPKQRWTNLHKYFLSLELQAVQKLGIPLSVYSEFISRER